MSASGYPFFSSASVILGSFEASSMPIGMDDASMLPKITDALLKKGYSEQDVEKILGGNLLRVMEAVERAAHR